MLGRNTSYTGYCNRRKTRRIQNTYLRNTSKGQLHPIQ